MSHFRLILLLLLQAAQVARITPGPAAIEGVVVLAGSNDGLAGVSLTLSAPNGQNVVVTSSEGRFAFRELQPGPHRLALTGPGLIRAEPIAFTLQPSDDLRNLRISMARTGSISGTIFDSAGEPVVRAAVHAMRFSYFTGDLTLSTVQTVLTNDLGAYRLFWLPPGDYIIGAVATDSQAGVLPILINPNSSANVVPRSLLTVGATGPAGIPVATRITENGVRVEEASLPIYFPGTPDAGAAARVQLRSGAQVDGIDIRIAPVRGYRVRGRIVSSVGGLVANTTLSVIPRYPDGRVENLPLNVQVSAGTFELTGIPAGRYFLAAQSSPQAGTTLDARLSGLTAIEVTDANLENVTIAVAPPYPVEGRVIVEGQPASVILGRNFQVNLRSEGLAEGPFAVLGLPGRPDAIFTMLMTHRGEFEVLVTNHREVGYVRSIRLGAEDGLNGNIHLDGPSTVPLEIVISARAGTLKGTVFDQQRQPVLGATVVLVPDALFRKRPDFYASANTDGHGKFRVIGIAPGVYRAFAWENVERNAWLDSEFVKRVQNAGRPVTFVEGSNESIELTAIPAE